jgi:succinoglycan biosynthesis transport protein ExoP
VELTGYFGILRRWWWTLLVATWVAAISGFLIADRIPRLYEAETRLLVGPINTDLDTQRAAGQLAQTYAQLVRSDTLIDSVKRELGLSQSTGELKAAITAVPNDVTRFVDIRVQDGDPQVASNIANQLAVELQNLASGSVGLSRQEGEILVIDSAEAPTSAIAPQVSLITLLSAFAGLLGAFVLVGLIEYARNPIRTPLELAQLTGVPTLGSVASTGRGSTAALPAIATGSRAGSDYRLLTAKLDVGRGERPARTLLVQGSTVGDGAGLVAANIAAMLAIRGFRVAFLDANSERGEASTAYGLADEPGLGDGIQGGELISFSVEPAPNVVLTVIPRGRPGGDVSQVEQVRDVLGRLLGRAEVVVVAAPPVDRSPGALLWAKAVDAVLLVIPKDLAKRPEVAAAVDSLRLVGANLVGTVLAEPPRRRITSVTAPLAVRQAIAQEPRRQAIPQAHTALTVGATAGNGPPAGPVDADTPSTPSQARPRTRRRRSTPES